MVNLIVSFFISFLKKFDLVFFLFFLIKSARFGSVQLDFKWCVYVVQSYHVSYRIRSWTKGLAPLGIEDFIKFFFLKVNATPHVFG